MAVVLKCNKDTDTTAAHGVDTPNFLNIITHQMSSPALITEGNFLWNSDMVPYQIE